MIGYAGTYTKDQGKGIYRFELDAEAGRLLSAETVAETPNATYLEVLNDRVFAIKKGKTKAGIATFEIENLETGTLRFIDDCLEEGGSGCHLTVTSDHNYLLDTVYASGEVRLYEIDDRAVVTDRLDTYQVEGDGPHERQDGPHAHFVAETPDKQYIAAVDLGADKIITLKIEDNSLVEAAECRVAAGSGPRHLVFNDTGDYAYIFTELSNEVIVAAYADGEFTPGAVYTALPEDFDGHSQGGAIRIHPNGRYIYVSNRGHNSITVFEIDNDGSALRKVQTEPTNGDWPRDFNITPDGAYLICAHERSHNLVLFKVGDDGTIARREGEPEVPEGVFVGFL
ncbi:lactonase family protein [Salinicoccus albus]|uniref:lactonase family protein n=1 Tax=Salinicoccus albus TaxID=418756 RepID=UPI000367BE22|nr:lactonase family protein [Salinicoccus albus]